MSLDVRGQSILSQGEYVQLVNGLPDTAAGSGVLQEWWSGEPIDPVALHAALNVEARLAAQTPEASSVIDRALARLERAFPDEGFPRRPA
jgi:hypothetical protein